MKKWTAAYTRVSTSHQWESGISIDDQRDRLMKAYPDARLYTDPKAVSASVPLKKRAAGASLLYDIECGLVEKVVVTKLDRIFRSAIDALITVGGWREKGVSLVILDFGGSTVDLSTPTGNLFFTMLSAFAEFERQMISSRIKDAYAASRRNGKLMGNQGIGAKKNPDSYRRVSELREEGLSYRAICRRLDEEGYRTVMDGKWSPCHIFKMLKGPGAYKKEGV